jgi:hypothetical protein
LIRRVGKKVGEIRRRGLAAGANAISFSGKPGRRKLRPGDYTGVLIVTTRREILSLPVLIEFKGCCVQSGGITDPAGDRLR